MVKKVEKIEVIKNETKNPKETKAYKERTILTTTDLGISSTGVSGIKVPKRVELTVAQLEGSYCQCEWMKIGVDAPAFALYSAGYHFIPLAGMKKESDDEMQIPVLYYFCENVNEEDYLDDLLLPTAFDLGLFGKSCWKIEIDKKKYTQFSRKMANVKDIDLTKLEFPFKLYYISAKYMKPTLDDVTGIQNGWIDDIPGSQETDKVKYGLDEIIDFKYPTPIRSYEGLGPGSTLNNALSTDIYAAKYNGKFFENNATARQHVDLGKVSQKELDAFRKYLDSNIKGVDNAHKTLITRNGVTTKSMSPTNTDMEFGKLMEMNRGRILGAFRVPLAIAGVDSEDIDMQMMLFKFLAVKPLQKIIASRLNKKVFTRFFPSFKLRFEFNPTDYMDARLKYEIDNRDLQNYVRTVNEVRADRGWGSVDWGNRPLVTRGAPKAEDITLDSDNSKKDDKKDRKDDKNQKEGE